MHKNELIYTISTLAGLSVLLGSLLTSYITDDPIYFIAGYPMAVILLGIATYYRQEF